MVLVEYNRPIISGIHTRITLYSTGMRLITTFRSTTDCIYDSGPISV